MRKFLLFLCFVSLTSNLSADPPPFKSTLFKKGTLVYSDDFDGEHDKLRWGPNKGHMQIKDGVLTISPLFENAEVAMKTLKRDHHLGLGVVAHLNKIPKKFVCHMRFKFETEAIVPARPSFQIGHHMISLSYKEGGGHTIKLPKGPAYSDTESGMKINEWVDLVIEYEEGKMLISVNGSSKIHEHELVTMKDSDRFTFKGREGSENRLLFDYVRLWEVKE